MRNLLAEVLQWLWNNQYRRASFDRIISIVPLASTETQLAELVTEYPHLFRSVTLKGGLPGLALHEDVNVATALSAITGETPAMQDPPLLVPDTAPRVGENIPRVTDTDVENEIDSIYYMNAYAALEAMGRSGMPTPLQQLTLCFITMRNGFTVIGKSACVSPELYNQGVGESLARADAIKQMWPLLGFLLAERRFAA